MKYCNKILIGAFVAGTVITGGCYKYPAPPSATYGETYTQRQKDKSDELLNDVSQLTLANAQKIAVINNPTYIAAQTSVDAARMRYYQTWGGYSPTINASINVGGNNNWNYHDKPASTYKRMDGFGTKTTLSTQWLVFDGLAREFKVLAGKYGMNYQRELADDEARLLMHSVAQAYNTVLLAIEQRRISLEDMEFQEKSLSDTKHKYDAGAVPLSDVLNFEIAVNQAIVNKISADYQYETAIYALAVLMGYPEGTLPANITFPDDFKTIIANLPAIEIYLDTALANRPDLKAYKEQLEVTRYQMYQTYSLFSPTVNAYFNMNYAYNKGRNFSSSNSSVVSSRLDNPSLEYGFVADWSLFNGFIDYNTMREYQANVATAEYSVAAHWFRVIGEVRAAYANYLQSVKQAEILKKTRDLSSKQRDLVDEEYIAGNTELTRLNEAQRDLVGAETDLAGAYINIQNAKAQLDAAVALNPVEFYKGDKEAKGKLSYTTEEEQTTKLATPQNNSVIPGATSTKVVAPKVNTPVVNNKKSNSSITMPPADPTKP